MNRCFIMQPFDDGPYDRRFDSVLTPAIIAAGVEPYRVDRDPGVSIPIDDIERGIRNSRLCLADITEDKPNVWFELGFAIAVPKPVVLMCSAERKPPFPFDVQHRNIILYKTDSPQDFDELKIKITAHISALLKKEFEISLHSSMSPLKETKGLAMHEVVCLVTVVQNCLQPGESVVPRQVKEDMSKAGFTDVAASLGLRSLLSKSMVECAEEYDPDECGEGYTVFRPTETGIRWLMDNQDQIILRRE